MSHNDEYMRSLERLARQGDKTAARRLNEIRRRKGKPPLRFGRTHKRTWRESRKLRRRLAQIPLLRRQLRELIGERGELMSYAWPGGYPIVYTIGDHRDADEACPECAQAIIDDLEDPKTILSWFIHYEGAPINCHCGKVIESAYGEQPDDDGGYISDPEMG